MDLVSVQRRCRALVALALVSISVPTPGTGGRVDAQGTTTATISGTVHLADGAIADDAHVRVINRATGYAVETPVRRGRFVIPGLEVGAPYLVRVRRIGAAPYERDGILLTLGQQLELAFVLDLPATRLDTVRIRAAASATSARAQMGTGTTISDSTLRRMPALNRDILDFARLVPQVGTRFGGLSGGGIGFRFNSYLIDGVSERLLGGNAALAGVSGGKAISIDAVKEYQVLLAPYDVRYGDFAGALVNAVTKSGTNELHGTTFLYARNEQLLAGTWTAPWQRWETTISMYYVGESGLRFTYTDSTVGGLGDLNADSSSANDPVYVPRNSADTSEIMFGGTADEVTRQQSAFESAISRSACLRRQRGRILARNSCIAPWVHSSGLAVRQTLPAFGGHRASVELELFNVLNLLRRDWGLARVPNTSLLRHVGQTAGPATTSQPIFRFDEGWSPYDTDNAESAYQLQLALRYSF